MSATRLQLSASPVPRTRPDQRAGRRALREQIARLEGELCGLACSAWPRDLMLGRPDERTPVQAAEARRGPPAQVSARLLSLGDLERVRDALAHRLADARLELAARAEAEERARRLVEEMLIDPASHRWVRVLGRDMGEPGCRSYHVRPRAGLLGMLAGWWRVVVSSGCP